jgi:hypothetical protein
MCFSHTDADIQFTLDVYRDIFPTFKQLILDGNVESAIQGQVLEPVFRKLKF